jgi:hypothetical protein
MTAGPVAGGFDRVIVDEETVALEEYENRLIRGIQWLARLVQFGIS